MMGYSRLVRVRVEECPPGLEGAGARNEEKYKETSDSITDLIIIIYFFLFLNLF